ncbi:MAG: N-methyl-L-tryptophan oxidase [Methylobacteriaceae bacterium]|nr:N-methyl-L-tryptophan oxidase [Methylobacteriaceae bacterium]
MIVADVAVIGLGAMGAAAAWRLARRGARVVGIDRFAPPHERGSSHGETRITRQAIGEGEELTPFALRAHAIWREIEAATGARLFVETGCLLIARRGDPARRHGRDAFLDRTLAAARRFGVAHETLGADDIRRRWPHLAPAADETGYFEPGGGYLRPEACIAAQLALARAAGATLRLDETVLSLRAGAASVEIETDKGAISAGRVVVAAGAFAPALLGGPFARLLRPTRQTLHWRAADAPARAAWAASPVYIWLHGPGPFDYFYGFPAIDGEVKSATECDEHVDDPACYDRAVAPDAGAAFVAGHHAGRLAGLGAVTRSATCLYTTTPDGGFVIDCDPRSERILVVSPCSGHGFKHSAAIGEAVAERLIDGAARLDLTPFSLARFA